MRLEATGDRDPKHGRAASAPGGPGHGAVGRPPAPRTRHRSSPLRAALRPRPLDVPVILALALLFLLVGLVGGLSGNPVILVNGSPAVVALGTSAAQTAEATGLEARPGAALDLAGDVRAPGRAGPGEITVNGSSAALNSPLSEGDQVVICQGRPALEQVVRKKEDIPFEVITEGEGPVVALVQQGQAGQRMLLVGTSSNRTGARVTADVPVNAVIRRSYAVAQGQKAVALTFDDGPGAFTPQILDVLAQKGVRGTFFVLGGNAAGQASLLQQVRDGGHEIENHTWSHADLTTLTVEQISSEITRTSDLLGGSRFLRPPYGRYNATVTQVAGQLGLRLAMWDVDTGDWAADSADDIVQAVKEQVSPGAIILMHDGGIDRSATVAALPLVIDWLLEQGYALTTLSRLTS